MPQKQQAGESDLDRCGGYPRAGEADRGACLDGTGTRVVAGWVEPSLIARLPRGRLSDMQRPTTRGLPRAYGSAVPAGGTRKTVIATLWRLRRITTRLTALPWVMKRIGTCRERRLSAARGFRAMFQLTATSSTSTERVSVLAVFGVHSARAVIGHTSQPATSPVATTKLRERCWPVQRLCTPTQRLKAAKLPTAL
jgi:hypothetical protein